MPLADRLAVNKEALKHIGQLPQRPGVVGRVGRAVLSPLVYAGEKLDILADPFQRAAFKAISSAFGEEGARRETSYGTIDLIASLAELGRRRWGEKGRLAGLGVGFAAELIVDPINLISFGATGVTRKVISGVAARARDAMRAANVPLRQQTARNILAVIGAASKGPERLTDPALRHAATILGGQFRDKRALNLAWKEGTRAISRIGEVSDEAAKIAAQERAVAPFLPRATRAIPAEGEVPAALRGTPLGGAERKVAAGLPESIRGGIAGVRIRVPFTRFETGPLAPEIQARVVEFTQAAGRAIGRAVPEGVKGAAEGARRLFVPLSRRVPRVAEIGEEARVTARATAGALGEKALAIRGEVERLGARTPDKAAELISRAARSDRPKRLESLGRLLREYNEARLRLQEASGVKTLAFFTGERLGKEAQRARELQPRLLSLISNVEAAPDLETLQDTLKALGEVASVPISRFPEMTPTRRVFNAASLRAAREEERVRKAIQQVEALQKRAGDLREALARRPPPTAVTIEGEAIPEAVQRAIGDTAKAIEAIPTRVAASRENVLALGRALRSAEANLKHAVLEATSAGKITPSVSRSIGGLASRTIGAARAKVDAIERGLEEAVKRGLVAAEDARLVRSFIRKTRRRLVVTKGEIARRLREATAAGKEAAKREILERELRGIERKIQAITEGTSKIARGNIGRIAKRLDIIGKTIVDPRRLATVAADAALGATKRGTPAYEAFRAAHEAQIEGALQHISLERFGKRRFLAPIAPTSAVIERVPLQAAEPFAAPGPLALTRRRMAPSAFRVLPTLPRHLRTVTPLEAEKIMRGEIGFVDHMIDVGMRAPHQVGQAFRDYVSLRSLAARESGDPGSLLLVATGSAAEKVAKKQREMRPFFEIDAATILARDIKATEKRILNAQTIIRSLETFKRLPTIEGEARIDLNSWARMIKAAGGREEAIGVIVPKEIGALGDEFLTAENVSKIVRKVEEGAEETIVGATERLYIVDRLVGEEITRTLSFWADPANTNAALATIDGLTNLWRRSATIGLVFPSLAFNIRNLLSDAFMALQAGVHPASRAWWMGGMLAFVSRFRDKGFARGILSRPWITDRLTRATYTGTELLELGAWHGLTGRGVSVLTDIASRNGEALRSGRLASVINTMPETFSDISASWIRLTMLIDGLQHGLGHVRAALRTKATLYDYSQLTEFERVWMRRFVPFYTWSRNNVPAQFRRLIEDPKSVLLPFKATAITSEKVREEMPDWLERQLPILITLDKRSVTLLTQRHLLPTADIDPWVRLFVRGDERAAAEIIGEALGGAPILAIEWATNVDIWRTLVSQEKVPITRFPDELERIDLFGIRVPRKFARIIPRPLSDLERILSQPELSPLVILGIPVREIRRERLMRAVLREAHDRKVAAANSLYRAIRSNDVEGALDALAEARRADEEIVRRRGEKKRPVAFRTVSRTLIEALADPLVTDRMREAVLGEIERDLGPAQAGRARRKVEDRRRKG